MSAMVGSIMVVGVLTCCTLLHSLCDLKAAQLNDQHSLILELMLYEFVSCVIAQFNQKHLCENELDHSTVIRCQKKQFLLRNIND